MPIFKNYLYVRGFQHTRCDQKNYLTVLQMYETASMKEQIKKLLTKATLKMTGIYKTKWKRDLT